VKSVKEACMKSRLLTEGAAPAEIDAPLLADESTTKSSVHLEDVQKIKKKRSVMNLWKRD
jgi:hypothetical protein